MKNTKRRNTNIKKGLFAEKQLYISLLFDVALFTILCGFEAVVHMCNCSIHFHERGFTFGRSSLNSTFICSSTWLLGSPAKGTPQNDPFSDEGSVLSMRSLAVKDVDSRPSTSSFSCNARSITTRIGRMTRASRAKCARSSHA